MRHHQDSPTEPLASVRFRWHRWRREATNFSLFKSRHADGQIVSQHQSGTHWLKFMLANALSYHYALPAPKYNHANDFIGGPKDKIVYPELPRLLSSHSIPPLITPWLLRSGIFRLPKYIVLVRDIRASLVSNYRKWADRYGVSFSTFLRGDPAGHLYNSDIWWSIRFLNAWGRLHEVAADNILIIHYETLLSDPFSQLSSINEFFGLFLSDEAIQAGIAAGNKTNMLAKADPERPPGEVHADATSALDWFDDEDKQFFSHYCEKLLRYDFGYDYHAWH